MIASGRITSRRPLRHACAVFSLSLNTGRTAAYRRLTTVRTLARPDHAFVPSVSPPSTLNSPCILPLRLKDLPLTARLLHSSPSRLQQPRPSEDIRDPPRDADQAETKAEEPEDSKSQKESKDEEAKDKTEDEADESESKESKKESKKDAPPPPPHGDKSPLQVFLDTLRSEFKASKEWNESTKQLASSAHQFTESDGVRKARAAYDATAGAATTRTGEAIKATGKALGSGAAYAWDTKVVQGIRGGVNATGRGIEKATRPVRETKAFQSFKEAVDDGSSSRYGGWVEKEERRKKKEARELKEVQEGKRPPPAMAEDPKYV